MKPPLVEQPAFGERLRALRKERGLSQRDLARERITPSYISLLESGRRVPTLEVLMQLGTALEVSLEVLTGSPVSLPGVSDEPGAAAAPPNRVTTLADREAAPLLLPGGADELPSAVRRARLEALFDELLTGPPSWDLVQVAFQLARLLAELGETQARFEVLTAVTGTLRASDASPVRLRAFTDLAAAARDAGDMTAALAAVAEARAGLGACDAEHTFEHVRLASVELSVRSEAGEDLTRLRPLADELLAAAADIDSPAVRGRAHWAVGTMLARHHRTEEAVPHLVAARGMLSNASLPVQEWLHFSTALASLLLDLDVEREMAKRHLDGALAVTEAGGWAPGPALLDAQARYLVVSGAPEQAEELCRTVLDGVDPLSGTDRARFCSTRARALAALGRAAEAADRMREAALLFEESDHLRLALECWRWVDHTTAAARP
ncbi:helix-turn-helix domain-containing protein [Streptomyces hawaiiensis]|uniref:helix-turn-helix domain-containing protein n=1 Tax=Streptomyces hawaiiensis TaxID=67305 RepID=UPI00364B24FD